jgi:hypothetical protein
MQNAQAQRADSEGQVSAAVVLPLIKAFKQTVGTRQALQVLPIALDQIEVGAVGRQIDHLKAVLD